MVALDSLVRWSAETDVMNGYMRLSWETQAVRELPSRRLSLYGYSDSRFAVDNRICAAGNDDVVVPSVVQGQTRCVDNVVVEDERADSDAVLVGLETFLAPLMASSNQVVFTRSLAS